MRGLMLNYNCHMWHSVLGKIKTQTRRIHSSLNRINEHADKYTLLTSSKNPKTEKLECRFQDQSGSVLLIESRYRIGEIAYLQEPVLNLNPYLTKEDSVLYQYCDINGDSDVIEFKKLLDAAMSKGAKWENKMFMSKKYARFYVKITGIKAERLKVITEQDCLREGIQVCPVTGRAFYLKENVKQFHKTPQLAYFSLLKQVGKEISEPNPWLFAYDFEICQVN